MPRAASASLARTAVATSPTMSGWIGVD